MHLRDIHQLRTESDFSFVCGDLGFLPRLTVLTFRARQDSCQKIGEEVLNPRRRRPGRHRFCQCNDPDNPREGTCEAIAVFAGMLACHGYDGLP